MVTSEYPKMSTSQSLRLETRQAEASHAELKRRIEDLDHQYGAQERAALADFEEKSNVINARFESQRADIASQLQQSLRESIEGVLREKRDMELDLLRRAHQDQADARKNQYDAQRRAFDQELFKIITVLITAGPEALPPRPLEASRPLAPSGRDASAETNPAPLAATEVPSRPQQVTSPLPTLAPLPRDTNTQPVPSQTRLPPQNDRSEDAPMVSPWLFAENQASPAAPQPQPSRNEQAVGQPVTSARAPPPAGLPPLAPSRNLTPAVLGHQGSFPHGQDQRPLPAKIAPKLDRTPLDPTHKRKAEGESNDQSPAPTPNRIKRSKLEKTDRPDRPAVQPSPPPAREAPSDRTVTFDEVYGTPSKPVPYKHVIVQFPSVTGQFYILRCDEHGVHFGEHPLRGAAKHLASAQHGYMSKAHVTAIETLGHRVVGCTKQLADKNNHDVLRAFKEGYKAFNANNLSQAKRAELGFPPLNDPQASQKAAAQRKPTTVGITDPVACQFYVTSGELRCPVLVLPWGDTSPVGLAGTLADTGIFCEYTDDGRPTGVPKPPKCYVYDEDANGIRAIRGWAKGYENGGPLERKREFPVLCVENSDYRMWSVGWAKAVQLSILDFDNPSAQNIPFIREARHYFYTRVLRQQDFNHAGSRKSYGPESFGTPTPRHAVVEDVDMEDSGDVHNTHSGGDSDQDSVSRALTESDNGVGRGEADSRRTSVSNRDESAGETKSREDAAVKSGAGSTPAQHIAAQALNLQAPPRSGFTAINSASSHESSASRSAGASIEPPSRAGSVSSAGGNHRRVFKIHARSSNRPPAQPSAASPSIVLPERPADGAMSPRGTPSQSHRDERRPSPASLQNIVQDFPAPAASLRPGSQSPKPAGARRPLPSGPMRSGSPARSALLSAVNAKLTQQPSRDSRAGSAPVQLPQPNGLAQGEVERPGSASAVPGLSRHASPQPSAPVTVPPPPPEPVQKREPPPPPIQLLPAFTPMRQLKTTPLATPTTSAPNTRANSPAPAQAKVDTPPTGSFAKPDTPILTPTLAQPAAFVPTMDVFDLAGFMDGKTELFRSPAAGQYLRLIDDHQSGVLSTPLDGAVALKIEPKKIKTVERLAVQGGAVCVVTIVYHQDPSSDGEAAAAVEPRTQTLVLEKARSTASGMLNGAVHARRLCRRLQEWNDAIVFPTPESDSGARLDALRWRFGSLTPEATPTGTGPGPALAGPEDESK